MKIVLATANSDKIAEIKNILKNCPVEFLPLKDFGGLAVTEDGKTFYENARKKAYEIALFTKLPALADDSGLCVDALSGGPGVYSSRYSGKKATYESNVRKLLMKMSGITNRKAKFVCVCALYFPDGRIFSARGEIEGIITREPFGNGGFGYDPVFFIPRFRRTFAEMDAEKKNAVSHRGKAFRKMAEIIKEIVKSEEKTPSKSPPLQGGEDGNLNLPLYKGEKTGKSKNGKK